MEPARLPKDVPPLLLRDTIELDNLRLAWPQILLDRRRASENLILYGCQNPDCKTATCFHRRKNTSSHPLRNFTPRSARSLALELATQDDPEKHLCPSLSTTSPHYGHQLRPPRKRDSASLNDISQRQPTPDSKPDVNVTGPSNSPGTNHGRNPDLGNPSSQEIGRNTKSTTPKDTKSFSQALINTKVFDNFYASSDQRSTPQILGDRFHPSDDVRPESRAGLVPVNGEPSTKFAKNTEQKSQSSIEASTHPDRRSSASPQHDKKPAANHLRPQTLSRFSKKTVKALVWSAHVSPNAPLKEQHVKNFFGWTLVDSTVTEAALDAGSGSTSILPFARQSIVSVLSDLKALSSSFFHEVHCRGDLLKIADSFNDMVQSFSWLQKLEGYPPIILPSLLQAADTFYASLLAMEDSERLLGEIRRSAMQPSIDDQPPEGGHKLKIKIEAPHIVDIILAALVATIPPCTEQVWLLVRDCHRKGVKVQNQVKDPTVIRSLQSVLDAFENDTALEILAKLVNVLSNGASVIRWTDKATSEDDVPDSTTGVKRRHLVDWLLHRLCTTGVRPIAYSKNTSELRWTYDLPSAETDELSSLSYTSMIVEWLMVFLMKRWDGKTYIELSSLTGNALEILQRFYERFSSSPGVDLSFQIPRMVAQIDFLDMPTEWPNPMARSSQKHILQYPFILDLRCRVSCSRAMNYSKMNKAYGVSIAASRLLAQTTFRDTLTGRSETRSQELSKIIKSYFVIEIRRQSILVDAYKQLWRRPKRELMKPLKVRMGMEEGEEGVDHGGVQQEFFRIAVEEALKPRYGLFTVIDEQTKMDWLCFGYPYSRAFLDQWEFVGLLFSLAVYNGLTLPVNFPLAFYLKLQGRKLWCPEEIQDGWPALAKGLRSLLEWSDGDVADVFHRTYEYVIETPENKVNFDMLAKGPTIRPITDGDPSPCMVTNENRAQYVEDYVFWLTSMSVNIEFAAFSRGFFTCISPQSLMFLTAKELKQLVEGTQDVTVEGLRKIAQYDGGYTTAHQTIQNFWRIVDDFSPNQIKSLLEFVTASDRLP
ncbi:MAG: hypothetical protein Q9180_002425, partial [Flavoplaca navasiana]